MNSEFQPVSFKEVQKFGQWWIWLIVYGVAAIGWVGFAQQIIFGQPFGNNPAPDWAMWLILLLVGVGLPVFFHSMRLIVEVRSDCIYIRYVPFVTRTIPFTEIKRFEVRTYSPIKEYGGWGIQGWTRKRIAYNVKGNEGVDLELTGGQQIMIGSQRSQELAMAIASGSSEI